ncbi:hypothetical protein [Kitasatospora sp. HPMI-4]|uniref:hypothetical protein n=1 Tax=Kitasatospora sp. HPMI-4 TaxID=3448443 RepID=UPI003F19500B
MAGYRALVAGRRSVAAPPGRRSAERIPVGRRPLAVPAESPESEAVDAPGAALRPGGLARRAAGEAATAAAGLSEVRR